MPVSTAVPEVADCSVTASTPAQFNQTTVFGQVRSYELDFVTRHWGSQSEESWYVSGDSPLVLADQMRKKWGSWLGIET